MMKVRKFVAAPARAGTQRQETSPEVNGAHEDKTLYQPLHKSPIRMKITSM
jgi:hypothetical protein